MSEDMTREQFFEEMIRQWAECNSVCDVAVPKKKLVEGLEKADRYMEILPGAEGYELVAMINVGYPAPESEPSPMHSARKSVGELVTSVELTH